MYNFAAFRYIINAPEAEAHEIATLLATSRPGAPNGSSFAVTADAKSGRRNIYLSETSFQTLKRLNVIPSLYQAGDVGDGVQVT